MGSNGGLALERNMDEHTQFRRYVVVLMQWWELWGSFCIFHFLLDEINDGGGNGEGLRRVEMGDSSL